MSAAEQQRKKRKRSQAASDVGAKISKLLIAHRDRVYVQANEVVRAASNTKKKKRPLELQLIDAVKREAANNGDMLEECPFLSELVILAKYCEDAMIVNDLALKQIAEWQRAVTDAQNAAAQAARDSAPTERTVIGNGFGFSCVTAANADRVLPIDRQVV